MYRHPKIIKPCKNYFCNIKFSLDLINLCHKAIMSYKNGVEHLLHINVVKTSLNNADNLNINWYKIDKINWLKIIILILVFLTKKIRGLGGK